MALNAADKRFLKEMIPHHAQAVEMAEVVIEKGSDLRVANMARAIRDGQTREIAKMKGWLADAGESPGSAMGGM